MCRFHVFEFRNSADTSLFGTESFRQEWWSADPYSPLERWHLITDSANCSKSIIGLQSLQDETTRYHHTHPSDTSFFTNTRFKTMNRTSINSLTPSESIDVSKDSTGRVLRIFTALLTTGNSSISLNPLPVSHTPFFSFTTHKSLNHASFKTSNTKDSNDILGDTTGTYFYVFCATLTPCIYLANSRHRPYNPS